MSEELDQKDENNSNYEAWKILEEEGQEGSVEGQESQSAEFAELEKAEQLLESMGKVLDGAKDLLSNEEYHKLVVAYVTIDRKLGQLKEKAAISFLPESRREAFAQYREKHVMVEPDAIDAVLMRARGKTNEEIGETLDMKKHSVEVYATIIYEKTFCSNRAELLKKFRK